MGTRDAPSALGTRTPSSARSPQFATRVWIIRRSDTDDIIGYQFGVSTDKVVPADHDGDGKTDIAVFRHAVPSVASGARLISDRRSGIILDRSLRC